MTKSVLFISPTDKLEWMTVEVAVDQGTDVTVLTESKASYRKYNSSKWKAYKNLDSPGTEIEMLDLSKALQHKDAVISFLKPKLRILASILRDPDRLSSIIQTYENIFTMMKWHGVTRIIARSSWISFTTCEAMPNRNTLPEKFYHSAFGCNVREEYSRINQIFLTSAQKHGLEWKVVILPFDIRPLPKGKALPSQDKFVKAAGTPATTIVGAEAEHTGGPIYEYQEMVANRLLANVHVKDDLNSGLVMYWSSNNIKSTLKPGVSDKEVSAASPSFRNQSDAST